MDGWSGRPGRAVTEPRERPGAAVHADRGRPAALAEIEPRRVAWARDLEQCLDPAALATTLSLLTALRERL